MKAYLEASELDRLEQAATNVRDRLLIRLLSRLGCRISEALGITVQDIDLERAAVTILHLKCSLHLSCPHCNARLGRSHVFCPKCGEHVKEAIAKETEHRKMRTLPLDADTMAMLKDFIDRGGPVQRDGKLLMFGINRHRAWQIIRVCAQRSGLPDLVNPDTGKIHGISPHRMRDAFAIHAMKLDDSGDGLRLLQEHLGHSSFNTTAKYRKISGEEHREWFDQLWSKPDKESSDG